MLTKEQIEWKPITGFEEYSISNNGKILSKKCELMKPYLCNGYEKIVLMKDNSVHRLFVHRLVAKEFIPNNENKKCVNHIDSNRKNNAYKNLEWVSHSENSFHSWSVGGCTKYCVPVLAHNTITGEDISFQSVSLASKITGVNRGTINNRLNRDKGIRKVEWRFQYAGQREQRGA